MKRLLIAFLFVFALSGAVYAQQNGNGKQLLPLYKLNDVETLKPDSTKDDSNHTKTLPEVMINNLHFQLADPKGVYLAEPSKAVELRKPIDLQKVEEEKRLAAEKVAEEARIKAEEQAKLAEEKAAEEAKIKAEEQAKLAEEKVAEEARIKAEEQQQLLAEQKRLLAEKAVLEARLKAEEQAKLAEEKAAEEASIKEPSYEVKSEIPKPALPEKIKISEADTTKKTDLAPVEEKSSVKSDKKEEIDYYLNKYSATKDGETSTVSPADSLMTPFRDSLFFKVLKDNRSEDIELKTVDVTSDLKPEGVVFYNVPQGAEGEYACQVLVLKSENATLNKLWISELIPGEIDSVYTQDINNDGQNDIVVISTTGGVSLLKSIRVYSYDNSRNLFNTIFAMNGIMEGLVDVRNGKILISETFPGGVNRAALYIWNGKIFERLEL